MAEAVVLRPQLAAVSRIIRMQYAARIGNKDKVPARGEQARERRLGEIDLPLLFAGHGIACVDMTVGLAALRIADLEIRPDIELRHRLRDRSGSNDVEVHAPFLSDLIVE